MSETRKPKRILHFSDGVLEEYSSEEESDEKVETQVGQEVVDPRNLSWLGWLVESARAAGGGVLGACDTAGEKLAWWFGITSPKYYYEIQEALRMKKEEEERKAREDAEMSGWNNSVEERPISPNTRDIASNVSE